jgi:hypothetical protein
LVRIGILLLAMFPAIVVPLVVLSPRPTARMLLATFVSWAVLTWLAIETFVAVDNPPRGEVAGSILLVHFGAALAGLASAGMVRYAGYRLIRSR